jgi:hypothetical protein
LLDIFLSGGELRLGGESSRTHGRAFQETAAADGAFGGFCHLVESSTFWVITRTIVPQEFGAQRGAAPAIDEAPNDCAALRFARFTKKRLAGLLAARASVRNS